VTKVEKGYCIFFFILTGTYVSSIILASTLLNSYLKHPTVYDSLWVLGYLWIFSGFLLQIIVFRDIYLRPFPNGKGKLKWTILVLFIPPLVFLYLWKLGWRLRSSTSHPTKGTKYKMGLVVSLYTALVALYGLFGTQTLYLLTIKYQIARELTQPDFNATLIDPASDGEKTIDGPTVSFLGYQFKSPWGEIKIQRETGYVMIIQFSSGIIVSASQDFDYVALLEDNPFQARAFKEEPQKGNYYFYEAMLNSSTKDVKILRAKKQVIRTFLLLSYRFPLDYAFEHEYYKFSQNDLKGFLFIGSRSWHSECTFYFFDEGSPAIKLEACRTKDREISREEILHVIRTFRRKESTHQPDQY